MFEMLKTPFKISLVLFALFLLGSAIVNGKMDFIEEFLNNTYKEHIRPALGYEEDTGPKPEDTLVAPFGATEAAPPVANEEELGLSKPHMVNEKVAEWLVGVMSEMLMVTPDSYDERRRQLYGAVDSGALQDYDSFLNDNNIMAVLREQNKMMTGFAEAEPILLKSGNFDGIYRWVYRVPVTITILDSGIKNYKEYNMAKDGRNLQLSIQAQIGRVEEAVNEQGLIIERLKFKAR